MHLQQVHVHDQAEGEQLMYWRLGLYMGAADEGE